MTDHQGRNRRKQRIRMLHLVLAGFLVLLSLTSAQADNADVNITLPDNTADRTPVSIEQNPAWNATVYHMTRDDCTIEWMARNTEIGVVKHTSDCADPLALQMPLLAEIVETFLRRDPNAQSLRTLFWGRIEPDYSPGWHELSFRLALAAYQSPGWDKKRGRPKNGDINGFVKDLANRAMIYPELKGLFARFHKTIALACAEKVLVVAAAKLPYFDQLKRHGVKATDKLPFDCMAWFSISDILEK